MNVMLDTCALLWLASGDSRLSQHASNCINEAGLAFVSVISGFEVALKTQRKKLELPAQPDKWFNAIVEHHGLELLPLTADDALRAPLLPDIHRDPCDRFIIAQALRLDVPVLTGDGIFSEYGISVIE
jgi:PIN domain nuclease of toxin-antitoxin system